ncbi:MAG: hypothetical protein KDI88_07750 [Gammaproteobacteria bacterium]|nr:hypothetical protein [Gammaproteobacteria bacterium]
MRAQFATLLLASAFGAGAAQSELAFDIYLDDRPVGVHRVQIQQDADQRRVSVEAEMSIDILFFNAFSYRHQADEVWHGDCIANLKTRTDDDGERYRVDASRVADDLLVTVADRQVRIGGCVRTFAYWNPRLLEHDFLLNTQTGDYEPARLVEVAEQPLQFQGRAYGDRQYRLDVGQGVRIDLWYDAGCSWQALQTQVENGRVLRYVRREG